MPNIHGLIDDFNQVCNDLLASLDQTLQGLGPYAVSLGHCLDFHDDLPVCWILVRG